MVMISNTITGLHTNQSQFSANFNFTSNRKTGTIQSNICIVGKDRVYQC
jgi:hypothetical protein